MNPASLQDYEDRASAILPHDIVDFYRGGAGNELTLKLNKSSYDRIRIRPRVLQSSAKRDLTVRVFGDEYSMPIGISPTALQKMAHPEGEVASARAAASRKVPFTLSTLASSSIEEVAKGSGISPKWFQVYVFKDRKVTKKLVQRAEKAGFRAIVVTVDTPVIGIRRADVKNRFMIPPNVTFANTDAGMQQRNYEQYFEQLDPATTWDDVDWLMKLTKLPVIVKGILTKEDAKIAVDRGVQGIWVSNHGARQLDSVPATIEALPEIVTVVGDHTMIIVDGGVTQGTDVFKALALGAKMVFIGRPALWGLAVNGQQGVENVLDTLKKELDNAMAIAGCRSVADITKNFVAHETSYEKI